MNEYIINKVYLNNNQYVKTYYGTDIIWKKYYNVDVDTDCITIELDSPGAASLTVSRKGDWRCDLFYSFNMKTWTPFNELHYTGAGDIDATVEFTNKIYLKGDIYSGRERVGETQYITLKINRLHTISGNLMSLVDNDTIRYLMFYKLFLDNVNLTDASGLIFQNDADVDCYNSMFYGCSSLVNAPELPATTLANACYRQMFQGCSSLTAAPELPATTLANFCYDSMFYECSSLVNAPELPATTLAVYCYHTMFYGCSSLTKAPILRAQFLKSNCYEYMFYGCSSLNTVTILATDISPEDHCLYNWLGMVSPTGTFKKISGVEYPTGESGIPEGWTGTDIFYLVNRGRQTDGTGRWAWHGYSNQEDWVSTAWIDNLENENFLMYLDSNNYIRDMLNDVKMWSAWHTEHNFDDLKLYSATDTDSKQVFLPCGYGTYQGTYYRIFGANFNGNKTTENKYSMQEFINEWGYGRSSTYIVSYEKKFYRYTEPEPTVDEIYRISCHRGTLCAATSTLTNDDCVYIYSGSKPSLADDLFAVTEENNLVYISKVKNGTTYYMYRSSNGTMKFTSNKSSVNIRRTTWATPIYADYQYRIMSGSSYTTNVSSNEFSCVYPWTRPQYYSPMMDTWSQQDDGNGFKFEDTRKIYRISCHRGTLCAATSTLTNDDCVYIYSGTKPSQADDLFDVTEENNLVYISKVKNGTTYYMYRSSNGTMKFTSNKSSVNIRRTTWATPIYADYQYRIMYGSSYTANVSINEFSCVYPWTRPQYYSLMLDTWSQQDDGNGFKFEGTTRPT